MSALKPLIPLPCRFCGEKPTVRLSYSNTGIYDEAAIEHVCMHDVRISLHISMGTTVETVDAWNKLMEVTE